MYCLPGVLAESPRHAGRERMARSTAQRLAGHQRRYRELAAQLADLGYISAGTVTRRLTDPEAALYQEWINNDRRLRAILNQMRKIAAEATQLIMDEAKNTSAKV